MTAIGTLTCTDITLADNGLIFSFEHEQGQAPDQVLLLSDDQNAYVVGGRYALSLAPAAPDMKPVPVPSMTPTPKPQATPQLVPQPMAVPPQVPQAIPQPQPIAVPQMVPQPMAVPQLVPQLVPTPIPQAVPQAVPEAPTAGGAKGKGKEALQEVELAAERIKGKLKEPDANVIQDLDKLEKDVVVKKQKLTDSKDREALGEAELAIERTKGKLKEPGENPKTAFEALVEEIKKVKGDLA